MSESSLNLHERLTSLAEFTNESAETGSLYALAKVLNTAFSHLNHLTISANPTETIPFSVKVTEGAMQSFPRREFTSPNQDGSAAQFRETRVSLPNFETTVVIGPNFNVVRDLPALTREVEKLHNQQMRGYGLGDPMVFINTSQELARYWGFIGKKLHEFVTAHAAEFSSITDPRNPSTNIGTELLAPTLEAYAQLYEQIGAGFKPTETTTTTPNTPTDTLNTPDTPPNIPTDATPNTPDTLIQPVDASSVLEHEWEKIEQFLIYQLGSIQRKHQKRTTTQETGERSGEPVTTDDPSNLLKVIKRFTGQLGRRSQEHILGELNTQARRAFLQHAQADLYRKAGLAELPSRAAQVANPTEVVENYRSRPYWLINFVKDNFPRDETRFALAKSKISDLKEQLKTATNETDKDALKTHLTDWQLDLAKEICALVYSEKFFAGEDDSHSYSDATEQNFVNCMVRGELLYQLWREYAGEEAFGVLIPSHYYSVVKLATGNYLSLDFEPEAIDISDIKTMGDHTTMYQASLYSWKARELARDPQRYAESELLHREAIRLAPNDPDFKVNLANLLSKIPQRHSEAEQLYREAMRLAPNNPGFKSDFAILLKNIPQRHSEAEQLYREAIRLAPNDPDFKVNLANLLSRIPQRHSEAEQLYREAMRLAPKNPWSVTCLAHFYHYLLENMPLAKEYYLKAIELMKQNPQLPNWLTIAKIEARIINCS